MQVQHVAVGLHLIDVGIVFQILLIQQVQALLAPVYFCLSYSFSGARIEYFLQHSYVEKVHSPEKPYRFHVFPVVGKFGRKTSFYRSE